MSTPVTMELVHQDLTVPPPDNLIAGNYGAVYTDTVKLTAAGEYKRGMLMMSGNDGYVSSTKAGVSTAGSLCILTHYLYGGGAERVLFNLANHLVQCGHRVKMITIKETAKSYELDSCVSTSYLLSLAEQKKNRLWRIFIGFRRLWSYIRNHQINAYVVFLDASMLMLKGLTNAK